MNGAPIIGCGLLGLGIVVLVIPAILEGSKWFKPIRPLDFHHTNKVPIPRYGGFALASAFIILECFIALFFPTHRANVPGRWSVILCSLAMFGLGFWDDVRPLGAKKKLVGQILIAAIVCWSGVGIEVIKVPFSSASMSLHGWGVLATIVWLVAITNLINLIDGVDGLAGGIALMLMGLLVYVGHNNGTFVLLPAGMVGALLGFLWFNFPPARIYLGDGGAYFLGFQIAIFSIVGSHKGSILGALLAPLFVLALPIVDTSMAILRRGLRGLPVFRPDRQHIHHRLLGRGMSRRKVVLLLYGLSLVFLSMGFAVFWTRDQLVPFFVGLAVLALLLGAGRLSFSREWLAVGRSLGNSVAMRQEIQYALCLTQWLAHEGERCSSLEELFQDLTFAARRLGFTGVQLTLADGQKSWAQPSRCEPSLHTRHSLQGGGCGVLEFKAPVCPLSQSALKPSTDHSTACATGCGSGIRDQQLFDIMAELLAESWQKATQKWKLDAQPLRFDLSLPAVTGVRRRPTDILTGSRQTPETTPKSLPSLVDGSIAG